MEILRIEKNIKESLINNQTKVEDLPNGLRIELVRLLNKLKGVMLITEFNSGAVLRYSNKNSTLDDLPMETRKEFEEAIDLLKWYFRERWYSCAPKRNIGAYRHCCDCQGMVPSGHTGPCPNPYCSSHIKWRRIIGSSYRAPRAPKTTLM